MSWAQPIIEANEPSSFRTLLVRWTHVDIEEWERTRARGRRRFIRMLLVVGWSAPAVMLATHLIHIVLRGESWQTLLAPSFLGWFVPLLVGVPALMHLIAPLEWSLIEERYRDLLRRKGRRPAAAPD